MRHHPEDVAPRLQMPAMLRAEPFGFASRVSAPFVVAVAEDHLPVALELIERRVVGEVVALRRARSGCA